MDRPILELRLPEELPAGAGVVALEAALRGYRVDDCTIRRSCAVIGELITEARQRPAFDAETAAVELTAHLAGDTMRVRVRDRRTPDLSDRVGARLSWKLARLGFVRELRCALGADGNVTECDVELPPGGARPAQVPTVAEDAGLVDDATAAGVELRMAVAEDAAGIVDLTYRTYGFTHVDHGLYSVAALQDRIRSDAMQSFVAQSPDGAIVGHLGLVAERDGLIPECGRLMVDPRWRGRGLAGTLGELVLADADRRGLPFLWGECVANHLASQRFCRSLDGVEVGLLAGALPDTLRMSGIDNELSGRMSLIPYGIPVRPGPARITHLPDHHHRIYTEVSGRLRLQRTVIDCDTAEEGPAHLEVSVSPGFGTGRIAVLQPGVDATDRTAEEFRTMAEAGLDVIYLDIGLDHPSAPNAIRLAEANEFFWAALLPDARPQGDVLRLQRIGWVGVDTGGVSCASDFGRRMVDYVLSERDRVENPGA
ncbi:MAG: GNAT family N-acetyltransferase [Mycobacterium sp.]|nr:GNAT family N-acetyltransferase [Mycobacterium sp.]